MTYQAVGHVRLAIMSADSFHACMDRAIVTKSRKSESSSVWDDGAGNAGAEARSAETSPNASTTR